MDDGSPISHATEEQHSGAVPSLRERIRSASGSLCLFSGIGILALLLADRTGELPWKMPRTWYVDRDMWVVAGLIVFVAGWRLLRDPDAQDQELTSRHGKRPERFPTRPGQRFEKLVLYTRAGCHLCEEAKETLESYRESLPPLIEVDIDADPALRDRFSTCVPVVEIDGRIRFRGRVNEVLLRRLIEATPPRTNEN